MKRTDDHVLNKTGVTVGETHFTHGLSPKDVTRAGEAVLMATATAVAAAIT